MDTVLKNTLDEIEGRLAEILAVLQDIRIQGEPHEVTVSVPPPEEDKTESLNSIYASMIDIARLALGADRETTGFCKCGEKLYVETVDGERFIACR